MTLAHSSVNVRGAHRYLRAPVPLHFPVSAKVPESTAHFEGRTALYQSLRRELGEGALVGSDHFLYWDPTDPKKCLAPDLMVRLGTPNEPVTSWKIWERGAPHVGVEIVSEFDASPRRLNERLERYGQTGIPEVVRFDPRAADLPLRLWDLFDGDLVERDLSDPGARFCDALRLYWCVVPDARLGRTLRLAKDAAGSQLLPTPEEAERRAIEATEAARHAEKAALRRIAELEAELARKG